MRVRAVFWVLLVCTCLGILGFAAITRPQISPIVQTQLEVSPSGANMTSLLLHITDSQGLPVDGAQVQSTAYMTNMNMTTDRIVITAQPQGNYLVHVHLSMAGPWAISYSVRADSFTPCYHTLYIQVT